jgi:hypothetical protein
MNETMGENGNASLQGMTVVSQPADCELRHYLYFEIQG